MLTSSERPSHPSEFDEAEVERARAQIRATTTVVTRTNHETVLDENGQPVVDPATGEIKELVTTSEVSLIDGNPEEVAVNLTQLTEAHVATMRGHLLALAPVLYLVREYQLYLYHPESFQSFEEWLGRSEIDLSLPVATDIINVWRYVVPQCEEVGIPYEDIVRGVSTSKLRMLCSPFRKAALEGKPLPKEERVALVEMAKSMTWEDMRQHMRVGSPHSTEPDAPINFTVSRLKDGRYRISATLDEEEMRLLDKRMRPIWLDPAGRILPKPES